MSQISCAVSRLWELAEAAGAVSDQANVIESLPVRRVDEISGLVETNSRVRFQPVLLASV